MVRAGQEIKSQTCNLGIMEIFNFSTQLHKGLIAEKAISSYLSNLGFLIEQSKNQKYGDILMVCGSKRIGIECKYDEHTTTNLFVETDSVIEKGVKGWIYTSCSDYIFYLFSKNTSDRNRYYIFKTEKLQRWFQELCFDKYHYHRIPNLTYHTGGYAIPIQYIIENVKNYTIHEFIANSSA